MGREVRRVPLDWDHPKRTNPYNGREEFQPMYDRTLVDGIKLWEDSRAEYYHGSLVEQLEAGDASPDPEYYRPDWGDSTLGYAVYETVSEGTPVTPTFATEQELIDYLVANGDYWDQQRRAEAPRMRVFGLNPIPSDPWRREAAESFVRSGWAPSLVTVGSQVLSGASDADRIEALTGDPPPVP